MTFTAGRLPRLRTLSQTSTATLYLRVFSGAIVQAHPRSLTVTLRMAEARARREGRLLVAVQYPDGVADPPIVDARITVFDPAEQLAAVVCSPQTLGGRHGLPVQRRIPTDAAANSR